MNQHENFQVQNLDDNMKRKFGLSTENLKMKNWFTSRWVDAYSEDKIDQEEGYKLALRG